MWTKKYRSQLLLINIRTEGFRFTLPLSLYALEDLVFSLSELLELVDYLMPSSGKIPIRPALAAKFCRTMIAELRSYGRWEMVEVKAHDTQVYIGFY